MSVRQVVVFLALAFAACGGDATGPKNLSGTWQYNATSLTSGLGPACNVVGLTLTIYHSGSIISGQTSGGTMQCTGLNFPSRLPEAMQLLNGQVVGDSVYFSIASASWTHAGTASGGVVRGTTVVRISNDSATVSLSGPFTLVKK